MQPGKLGRLLAPGDGGPHSANLVRRDRLAVSRAADDDAQAARVLDGGVRSAHDVRRVVVVITLGVRAAVDRIVACLLQPLDEPVLQHETRVVGSKVDAHGTSLSEPPAAGGRGWEGWER